MEIVNYILILVLAGTSFFAGKWTADSYHEKINRELLYQIRLNAAKEGVGYVAPPPRRRVPIGQQFMDKLKENGRAVQKIDPNAPIS